MQNYGKSGEVVTLTAPNGGVVSGTAYKIGSIVVVATASVAEGLPFEAQIKGVVNLPKPPSEAWEENDKLYFDESEGVFTLDDDTAANALVGVAVQPVPAGVVISSDADPSDLLIEGLVITVLDYAALAGKTVSVTVGGVTTDLLEAESGDWEAATGNNETATSLAEAIAGISGIHDADDDGAEVTVTPGTGASAVTPAIGSVRLDGVAR